MRPRLPFSGSLEALEWENDNCCRCTKYSDDAEKCDLMRGLAGCVLGIPLAPELERRIGCSPEGRAPERCGEIDPDDRIS